MDSLVLAPFSSDGLDLLGKIGSVTYEPWTESKVIHDPVQLGIRLAEEEFNILIVEADFLFQELFEMATPLYFAALCRGALNQVELDAASKHGITIVHTPGRNAQAVAELVIGEIFSLIRHIYSSYIYIREGNWVSPIEPYEKFRGKEISSVKLGIIGLGNVGSKVALIANKLGMEVFGYDPYLTTKTQKSSYIKFTDLNTLLNDCNIVTLHVSETSETHHLIKMKELSLLGSEGYLINVSSPNTVSDDDLFKALSDGTIAGAAIDIHESHPIPKSSKYLQLKNVLLTPHIGGASVETIDRYSAMVINDLNSFCKGEMPKHIANPEVWPTRRSK